MSGRRPIVDDVMVREAELAMVWGNCQAAPLADLLRPALASHELRVVTVPPVYLADENDVRRVHELARRCAVLVTQPIRDEYEQPGCGADQLVALLPPSARVVRLPVVYDVGAFPFQVRGYATGGRRVDAPITDYHDLRVVQAAAHGWSVRRTIDSWTTVPDDALRAVASASLAELRRREVGQDVLASDLVALPDAMWTMTHPTNQLLAELARRVLRVLDIDRAVSPPPREYLGQRRAPIDARTVRALGWAVGRARSEWLVDGRSVPLAEVVSEQLNFYARHPDVVRETLRRNIDRSHLLATATEPADRARHSPSSGY